MKSIRQNTFETNSSSAHVLTIVKKSLEEKLLNHELVYAEHVGLDSDSYEVQVCEITEKSCITLHQLVLKLKDYFEQHPDDMDYYVTQAGIKLEDDYIKEHYADYEMQDCIDLALQARPVEQFLGILGYDADKTFETSYKLSDEDALSIKLVEISC